MAATDRLRALLGESIPEGGDEKDTLFTEAQLLDMLAQAGDEYDNAAYDGWRIKMAHYAGLVNVAEGSSKRDMGDLLSHAKEMVEHFASAPGIELSSSGRTRIGKIVRP